MPSPRRWPLLIAGLAREHFAVVCKSVPSRIVRARGNAIPPKNRPYSHHGPTLGASTQASSRLGPLNRRRASLLELDPDGARCAPGPFFFVRNGPRGCRRRAGGLPAGRCAARGARRREAQQLALVTFERRVRRLSKVPRQEPAARKEDRDGLGVVKMIRNRLVRQPHLIPDGE